MDNENNGHGAILREARLSRRELMQQAVALGLLPAFSGVLAACGASGSPNTSTTQNASTSGSTSASAQPPTQSAAATPKLTSTARPTIPATPVAANTGQLAPAPIGGGASHPDADPEATLTYGRAGDVVSADPQVEGAAIEIQVSAQVFAPLLTLTPDNGIAQNVATSMDVTNGGKTYTFKLRKTNYSDGKPVTAHDYAYAIKRACSPVVAGTYSSILFAIKGVEAWRTADTKKTSPSQMRKLEQAVDDSIKALDNYTLQIQLSYPAGYFPYVMTTWVTYPSRKDLVEAGGKNWWKSPKYFVGNGPFKLESFTYRGEWVFKRNDDYFRGKPGIKTLIFKYIGSPQTAFLAYTTGQVDLIDSNIGSLPASFTPRIENNSALKQEFHRSTAPTTNYLQFYMAEKPFDNVKVRQAFSYAMDRERYVRQVSYGVGQPAGEFIPPGIPGHETQYQQEYNLNKARSLLAEAGYRNGQNFPNLPMFYDAQNEDLKQQVVFWTQQFKQSLNVDIQPTPVDGSQIASMRENKSSDLKIDLRQWTQDYPHPQDWLTLAFATTYMQGPVGWDDAKFKSLLAKADKLPLSQALPLYQRAGAYLAQQAPVAFYSYSEFTSLIKPDIKGFVTYSNDPWGTIWASEKVYKTKS